jgi:hypothetical protein
MRPFAEGFEPWAEYEIQKTIAFSGQRKKNRAPQIADARKNLMPLGWYCLYAVIAVVHGGETPPEGTRHFIRSYEDGSDAEKHLTELSRHKAVWEFGRKQ